MPASDQDSDHMISQHENAMVHFVTANMPSMRKAWSFCSQSVMPPESSTTS
jgi:hypothetical protein